MAILEESSTLRSIFNKVILIVADGLTKELCISAYLVAKRIMVLYRKSGPLFVALYLNKSNVQHRFRGSMVREVCLPDCYPSLYL